MHVVAESKLFVSVSIYLETFLFPASPVVIGKTSDRTVGS